MKRLITATLATALLATGTLVSVSPASAAPANTKTVYTNLNLAKACPDGYKKTRVKKTQRVTWIWANGDTSTKKVRKGKKVCRTNVNTTPSGLLLNTEGTAVGLPVNFPKNPTADDIRALGFTRDTPVSPFLRLPQPTGPAYTPAELALTVRPVSSGGRYEMTVGRDDLNPDGHKGNFTDITWRFTGGNGLLRFRGTEMGVYEYVPLNPNGTITVVQTERISDRDPDVPSDNGKAQLNFWGAVVPDYGQANLPESLMADWNIPAAKDWSGIGTPVGVNANPAGCNPKRVGACDGVVFVMRDTGAIVGNYNY